MKKILSLLVTLSLLISCQEEQNPVIEVSSISIEQEDMTLEEGESTMLSAVVLPEDADDKTIKWSSSDKSKVIVSSAGKVVAMSLGKAVITAEAGKKTDFITITVIAKTVPVKGVSLNPAELTIKVGESGTITPDITPADATNKQVSWASSDTDIATIEDGTVTGIKPGSTTITATTDDGGLTAECIVTVKNNLAPSVTGEAEHISAVSAVLSGEANLDAKLSSSTKMGIVWSAAAKAIPSDAEVIEATEIKANEEKVYTYSYSVKLPGLKENSTYYYCSFVTVNGESYYGDTQEFTTNELASLLESLEATDIKASGATLNGKADLSEVGYVYEEGSVELGFLWGNAEDNLDKSVKCGELKEGCFSTVLTGLTHKTQYWYKAYVKLGEDVLYGSVKTFSTGSVPVESISLDITEHIFHSIGEAINLKATIYPEDASNKEIKWESEDEKVATVDENGKVTAIGNGTTTITVTTLDQNKKATCTISVAQAVAGVILTPSSTTIKEGAFIELVPTISPANAANKNVIWTSNNTAVATVNNGVVTGVSPGSAIITVTTEDGGKTATCSVVVESNLAPSVTVGAEHISTVSVVLMGKANLGSTVSSDLKVGFQYSRSAGILPSNSITIDAENVQADYSYSNSITGLEPATTYYYRSFVRQNNVDTYGETKAFTTKDVTALLETKDATGVEATKASLNGKLDLTDAQYTSISYGFYWGTSANSQNNHLKGGAITDNSYTANLSGLSHKTQYWYKAYVTLDSQTFSGEVKTFTTDVVAVESVSLNKEVYTFNTIGNTLTLIATVLPVEATDKSVAWTSDNTAVATVDSYGKVTARGNGTAKITVTTTDQHKTASCVITVAQWVTGISLDKTSITLNEGQEQTLTPTINPSNAANKSLRWTSSNTSVATVDAEGKVTAVSKGTATIKAEAKDGSGKYASCSVTVKRLVSSIQLNKTSISIYNGKSEPLTATVIPSDASNTSVTWTSSNTSVAIVSSSGMVTGKSRGIAAISVTANDGSGAHATCEVEVKQYVTSITLDKISLSLGVEEEARLSITSILPSDANDKSYTWSSSNNAVATVDNSGKVIARSRGEAIITATANDGGGVFASCSVQIGPYTITPLWTKLHGDKWFGSYVPEVATGDPWAKDWYRNVAMDDEFVYVSASSKTAAGIYAIEIGDPTNVTPLNVDGIEGGTFFTNCVRTIADGDKTYILAGNLSYNGQWEGPNDNQVLKLYVWKDRNGAPEKMLEFPVPSDVKPRLGDKFEVWGDWSDGLIFYKNYNSDDYADAVYVFTLKNGVVNPTPSLKRLNAIPEGWTYGSVSAYYPYTKDSGFMSGWNAMIPYVADGDNYVCQPWIGGGYMDYPLTCFNHGVSFFTIGGEEYIAYVHIRIKSQEQENNAVLNVFKKNGSFQETFADEDNLIQCVFKEGGVGEASANGAGDLAVRVIGGNAYAALSVPNIGFGVYKIVIN